MGVQENRHTQLDMLTVAEAKSLAQASESTGLRSSISHGLPPKSVASNKKRARSPEDALDATTVTGKAKSKTPKSVTTGSQLRVTWGSPWGRYEKIYSVELGGPVEVAIRKAPTVELVHVRLFPKSDAETTLYMFRHIQHRNIVAAIDAFRTDDGLYIALEYMHVSLEWVVKSPAYPNEQQLAAILGQVLDGVAYLAAEGYEQGSLSCSDILLKTNGDVKISIPQPKDGPGNVKALSSITMELMQKYVKEDGAVGVDDLLRWHSNSDAVGFLSATTSAGSAVELLKHPLLSRPWQKESLIGMISLAQVCTRGRYKYTPRDNSGL